MHKFLILLMQVVISYSINYITNGNFDNPIINPPTQQTYMCPDYWMCKNIKLLGAQWNNSILFGQFVHMKQYRGGILSQSIILPSSGSCDLQYYQSVFGKGNYDAQLQIWWNNELVIKKPKANETLILQSIPIQGVKGNNTLQFREVGKAQYAGTVFDNISLTCDFKQSIMPSTATNIFSLVLSAPISSLSCTKYVYIFLGDLWLYSYDLRDYRGIMNDIFFTASSIDNLKFRFLSNLFNENDLKEKIVLSNFANFTQAKFIEQVKSSSTLLDSNFQFIIFTVPQTILTCLLLYGLYQLFRKYKLSRMIRPYYFIKTIVIQNLFQQNICYFVYICFSHLRISFTFSFFDKFSLLLTASFLFIICIFSLTFYCFIGQYLRKNSSYFNPITNRGLAGYSITTYNFLLRSFMRGCIFYFLRYNYSLEILMLSTVELISIFVNLIVEQNHKVFKRKIQYCFQLIYYCLHLLLNTSLGLQNQFQGIISQKEQKILAYLLEIQLSIIKVIIGLISLSIILDLLPLKSKLHRLRILQKKKQLPLKVEQKEVRKIGKVQQRLIIQKIDELKAVMSHNIEWTGNIFN